MIKLIQGDCLNILQNIDLVDVVFTSPPYNRRRNDKYKNYKDDIDDYYVFLKNTIDNLLKITKKYVFVNIQTNYYNKKDVYKIIGEYCNLIQQVFVWTKTNPMPASGNNITNAFEYIIVFGEKPLKSNTTYTKNHISTSVNSSGTTKIHKAVMKQTVSDWFIEKFTKEQDIVLDPFMGLGTTGISCIKYKRNFIGIELGENYFNIAKQRIEEAKND